MAGVTVVGAASAQPEDTAPMTVEVKGYWGGTWVQRSDLECVRATVSTGLDGAGTAEFVRRYGTVKGPLNTGFTTVFPIRLDYWWIRVSRVTPNGPDTLWLGQIVNESRRPYSSGARSGVQTFIAYDAFRLLDTVDVSRSVWLIGGAEYTVHWVPTFNAQDEQNVLYGNRADSILDPADGSWTFGGKSTWSRYTAARYILRRFATPVGGPYWYIFGQWDALNALVDVFSLTPGESAGAAIRKLIPPSTGLSYRVEPVFELTPDKAGFALVVFALSGRTVSYGSASLPNNPQKYTLELKNAPNVEVVHIAEVSDQRYATIRIVGGRIVCCCSLFGKNAPAFSAQPADGSLVPKYNATTEEEYRAGTGNGSSTAEEHDLARRAEKFADAYRQFGAPADWDHQSMQASPACGSAGTITRYAQYTNQQRSTLDWIPLLSGWDYSWTTPVNNNDSDYPGDLMKPMVWLYDWDLERYIQAQDLGYSVHVSKLDWGVRVTGTPNHLLAKGHWTADELLTTETEPTHDYDRMIATIAFETDYRLVLEYRTGLSGSSVKEVQVPDAQLWWLAPNTFLGIKTDNPYGTSPGSGTVLRNDASKLHQVMCGMIARYQYKRLRAEIHAHGTRFGPQAVGQMINFLEGSTYYTEYMPVTGIDWTFSPERMTVVRAGFAT